MSRYIDIDDISLRKTVAVGGMSAKALWRRIQEAPSIDIVFCEDCRECVEKGVGADCPSGYGYLYCTRKKSVVNEDDYCSWGVRR